MSIHTRAKDIQGSPANGGRFATSAHRIDDSVTLTREPSAHYDDLLAQSWDIHRQMEQLKIERNEVLLQAAIARAKEQFPTATELRLGHRARHRNGPLSFGTTAVVDADGTRREAGDGTIHTDNWQSESADGKTLSIALAIQLMEGISAITKDGQGREDRFDYDPETGETIIPLQ